jgi:hypothetical protein
MTDAEYKESDDPVAVIEYLRGRLHENQLRQIGCAYFRRIWYIVRDRKVQRSVELVEQWLSGPENPGVLAEALRAARDAEARAKARQKKVAAAAKRTRYPSTRDKRMALADLRIARTASWLCEVQTRPTWALGTTKAFIADFFRTEARRLRKGPRPAADTVDTRCARLLAASPGEFRAWAAIQPNPGRFALASAVAEELYAAGATSVKVGQVERKKGAVAHVLTVVVELPDDAGCKRAVIAAYRRLARRLQVTEPMSYVGERAIEVPTC